MFKSFCCITFLHFANRGFYYSNNLKHKNIIYLHKRFIYQYDEWILYFVYCNILSLEGEVNHSSNKLGT